MAANTRKPPQLPPVTAGARIGLLGGSFNPAHLGHIYISDAGLKRLNLDQVWWLVSPGNPLKLKEDLAPLDQRLEVSRKITKGKNIEVLDFEAPLGLVYTIDTLRALKAARPDVYFIWLMGADCFAEFPKWKSWDEIMSLTPVAVFSRPGYSARALAGEAASKYSEFRHPENKLETLTVTDPPCWGYIEIEEQDISSTKLRQS